MSTDFNMNFDDFENDIIGGIVDDNEQEPEIIDNVPKQDDIFDAPIVKQKAQVPANNFTFDFAQLGGTGVVVGDIGLQISRYAVDKLRFTTANKTLMALVSPQVIAIKTHYIEGVGSILCHQGRCCELDSARIRYCFPVVVYDTDKRGKPVSRNLQFKCLCVGKEAYDSIMTKHELNGDITGVDLLVTCSDEGYQRIQIDTAGECRWKKNQAMVKEVTEFWSKNAGHLLDAIAKKSSDEAINLALGLDAGPTEADVDFNDLFE